jgi:hypothetical protein
MADNVEFSQAIGGLIRAGVSMEDASNLIGACQADPRLTLSIVTLPGEPRIGDRVRQPSSDAGMAQTLEIVGRAAAGPSTRVGMQRWAVIGIARLPAPGDEIELDPPS